MELKKRRITMNYLIENVPNISLDAARFPFACIDMNCEGFSNFCRIKCGTISCSPYACSPVNL